jgi:hypothetical protein
MVDYTLPQWADKLTAIGPFAGQIAKGGRASPAAISAAAPAVFRPRNPIDSNCSAVRINFVPAGSGIEIQGI